MVIKPGYSTQLKLGFAVANEPLYDPRPLMIKKVGKNFWGSKFVLFKTHF